MARLPRKPMVTATAYGTTVATAAALAISTVAAILPAGLAAVLPALRVRIAVVAEEMEELPPAGDTHYLQYFEVEAGAWRSMQQTADFGYIMAGWGKPEGSGNQDIYLAKGTSLADTPDKPQLEGYRVWSKFYGGSGPDIAYAVVESRTADGTPDGYVLAGAVTPEGGGHLNAVLLKTGLTGNLDPGWSPNPKLFAHPDGPQTAFALEQTFDDRGQPEGYLLAGRRQFTTPEGPASDLLLIKTDLQGRLDPRWPENPKTIRVGRRSAASSVQQTFTARHPPRQPTGYAVAGSTSLEAGGSDAIVVFLDLEGNVLPEGQRTFHWAAVDIAEAIRQTFDATGNPTGFVVAGRTSSNVMDAFLLKLDAAGKLDPSWPLNPQRYGAEDFDTSNDVRQTFDDLAQPTGYILAGESHSPSLLAQGGSDTYLVRTDLRGRELWHKLILGSGYDVGYAVQQVHGPSTVGYATAGQTMSTVQGTSDAWLVLIPPGRTGANPPRFRRGDSDGNEKIDLTDAIFTLNWLFLGSGKPPPCLDAADTDDTAQINLTDAVRILSYLFQGAGEESIAPPGPTTLGEDPTPDDGLSCDRYPAG